MDFGSLGYLLLGLALAISNDIYQAIRRNFLPDRHLQILLNDVRRTHTIMARKQGRDIPEDALLSFELKDGKVNIQEKRP